VNLVPARDLGMQTLHFESAAQIRRDLPAILGIELTGA
jgi:hypothetical protein